MAAVNAPLTVGAKWPWMVQFAPAARLVPQLFAKTNEEAFAPVTPMLVMDKASLPVLVNVTDRDALPVPTVCVPNDRPVADSDATGPRPVPLSAMLCGEAAALSVTVMAAVRAPATLGAKWPWMVHCAPTARLVPQLFAKSNEEAFVPVTPMLAMLRAAVPVLVMVTVCDALPAPTFTLPNAKLVAES